LVNKKVKYRIQSTKPTEECLNDGLKDKQEIEILKKKIQEALKDEEKIKKAVQIIQDLFNQQK
jgi:hypothetical protein